MDALVVIEVAKLGDEIMGSEFAELPTTKQSAIELLMKCNMLPVLDANAIENPLCTQRLAVANSGSSTSSTS